ncbi:GGDEF domain-containing protein [Desulfolucanica intricata]|uniref:GGDEF domain-containing protein n=1 Tax=Desulfolucanica intricata TaxID=1285191 RepID=UPI000829698F|nr:sensor domain-containing diguanylate cyclase [Desulfolucanica intricata]
MRVKRGLTHILYTWLVIFLAIYFLGDLLPQIDLDFVREILIMLALGILAEWVAVTFPQGQLSAGFAVVLSTFMIYGTAAAAWVSGLSALIGQGVANRGNPLRTTLFNAGMYVLAALGAAELYTLAGGEASGINYANAAPLLVFTCSYFAINNLLVYFYQAPYRQRYPLVTWSDALQWAGFTYLLSAPFGILMVLIYKNIGIYGILLFFVPVLVMQFILRIYVNLALANRELTALYEVARRFGAQVPLEELLELILTQVRSVIPYHTGVVYVWSGAQGRFQPAAVHSPYAGQIRQLPLEKGEGILGQLVLTGRPRILFDGYDGCHLKSEQGWVRMQRSLLAVPLLSDGDAVGLIALGDKRSQAFDKGDLQLMTIMSGQAKVAIIQSLLHKQIEAMSVTDGLTKVHNRKYFFLRAQAEYERALTEGHSLILVIIDVDYFKPFNDRHGYWAGDNVLMQLGRLLKEKVGNEGLLGRTGGQEFALLLPGVSEEEGHLLADSLRQSVRTYPFSIDEYRTARITVSLGLAVFPKDAGDLGELFKKADRALLRAKKGGKDKLVHFGQLQVYGDV